MTIDGKPSAVPEHEHKTDSVGSLTRSDINEEPALKGDDKSMTIQSISIPPATKHQQSEDETDSEEPSIRPIGHPSEMESDQIRRLRGDLERRRFQSRAQGERIARLEGRVAALKNYKKQSEFELEDLRKDLQARMADLRRLERERDAWKNLPHLENINKESRAALEVTLSCARQEIADIESAQSELQEKLGDLSELEKFRVDAEEWENTAKDLQVENDGMDERIGWLLEENSRLRDELEKVGSSSDHSDTVLLQGKIKDLEKRLKESQQQVPQSPVDTSDPIFVHRKVLPTSPKEDVETSKLRKELDKLRTWAKGALAQVERLEQEKVGTNKTMDALRKKIAHLEGRRIPFTTDPDDQGSVDSNQNIKVGKAHVLLPVGFSLSIPNNAERDTDSSIGSAPSVQGGMTASQSRLNDGRPWLHHPSQRQHSSNTISINGESTKSKNAYIENIGPSNNVTRKGWLNGTPTQKTFASLVKEVMKLRNLEKETALQIEELQVENKSFRRKLLEYEKMIDKEETPAQLREKLSELYKIITEERESKKDLQLQLMSLRTHFGKETEALQVEIDRLRNENVSFFRRLRDLESEASLHKEDINCNHAQTDYTSDDEGEPRARNEMRRAQQKLANAVAKNQALQRYNSILERTLAKLRNGTTLSNEINATIDQLLVNMRNDSLASTQLEALGNLVRKETARQELKQISEMARCDEATSRLDAATRELDFVNNQLESVEEEKILMEADFQSQLQKRDVAIQKLEQTVTELRELKLSGVRPLDMLKRDASEKTMSTYYDDSLRRGVSSLDGDESSSGSLCTDDYSSEEESFLTTEDEAGAGKKRISSQKATSSIKSKEVQRKLGK